MWNAIRGTPSAISTFGEKSVDRYFCRMSSDISLTESTKPMPWSMRRTSRSMSEASPRRIVHWEYPSCQKRQNWLLTQVRTSFSQMLSTHFGSCEMSQAGIGARPGKRMVR